MSKCMIQTDLLELEDRLKSQATTTFHSFFRDRAILTPKNLIVDEINNYVMSLIPGEERTYLSCDSPCPISIVANRNLDINVDLCNGTRLIITRMGRYVLEGRVISRSNIGDKVYVPRLSLQPSDTIIPYKFQRRSIVKTSWHLPTAICILYGQLYVAVSRITSRKGLKILITDENGDYIDNATNVVYKEVFHNV
ncbi:PIF1-like helicase [Medicago truncatula]|uniref:PIF1-like helicase n=1 Tax=Medicago truncatula TaxID=3880 RepID=G7J2I1_MEDTR|nr:PIF1-like helicase [Medicago truncatula]